MNMGGGYLNALLLKPIFGSIVIYSEIQSDIELVNDIENILSHYTKISFHRYRLLQLETWKAQCQPQCDWITPLWEDQLGDTRQLSIGLDEWFDFREWLYVN